MSALLLAAAEAATAARAIHFSNSGGVRAEQHEQASSIPIRAARRVRQQASKQCDHLSQGGGRGEGARLARTNARPPKGKWQSSWPGKMSSCEASRRPKTAVARSGARKGEGTSLRV